MKTPLMLLVSSIVLAPADAGLNRFGGRFYENFTLSLLESKGCVGWHWFKYIDNDPDDTKADPSNRDSNKRVVSNRYEPYAELLAAMKRVNERTCRLMDHFGSKK